MRWKINRRVLLLLKQILIKLRKQTILAIAPQNILTTYSSSLERYPQFYFSKIIQNVHQLSPRNHPRGICLVRNRCSGTGPA